MTSTLLAHFHNTRASARLGAGVLLLTLLAMTGCNPPKQMITYYAPSSAGNVRITNSAGPANEAVIEIADYNVRIVVVAQPSYDPARIWMNIHLPKGQTLRVVDDQFTIAPRDGDREARVEKITYIRGTTIVNGEVVYRELKPGELFDGASEPTHTLFWGQPTTVARQFEIVCPLGQTLPAKFDLALPGLEISGKPVHLPKLRFTRTTGAFHVPNTRVHHPW